MTGQAPDSRQRQEQPKRIRYERYEAVLSIKAGGAFVLSHPRKDLPPQALARWKQPGSRYRDKGGSQPFPLPAFAHHKARQDNGAECGPENVWRFWAAQSIRKSFGRRESEEAENWRRFRGALVNEHKRPRNSLVLMLAGRVAEEGIQRFNATIEMLAIMTAGERFNAQHRTFPFGAQRRGSSAAFGFGG